MNMENLYKFRSVLRDLYMRETSLNGDLVSDLYNNIDSRKAKSVYIAIQDFQISVTLFENCNIEDLCIIKENIKQCIRNFIMNNIAFVNIAQEEKNEFIDFVQNNNLIIDSHFIGLTVNIAL